MPDLSDLAGSLPVPESPLRRKTVLFLGSSVTYGAASGGISFPDFIGARNRCTILKEAVSGTTLADIGEDSYIGRLKKLDPKMRVDLFVCQLSTNDASQELPLGTVEAKRSDAGFDPATIAGAIEFILCYARKTWNCPVVFYTNPYYEDERYARMVKLLKTIQKKWEIDMIDLYSDSAFNRITERQRSRFMADSIHPTREGYLEWWTPVIEAELYRIVG